jgi:hypothetical protein
MAQAKGIQASEIFKLGKAPAKRDERNLMFAALLKAPVTVPDEYDFDLKHNGIPTPMFSNDVLGCCVISGRAHQTLRFEDIELSKVIKITNQEVEKEYFKETGGPDSGLVVLDSLNIWRQKGWTAAGRKLTIRAFTQLNQKNHKEVRTAIFLNLGVGLGVSLPKSAQKQINAGKPWDVVTGPDSKPGSWGGHYIFVPGYTKIGPVCVTWGRKQQLTWKFVDKYCDEAYAIFDAADTNKTKKALKMKDLTTFLSGVTKPSV